jgi:diacylglycerol kinase
VWQRLPRQEGVEAKEAAMRESTQAAIGAVIVAVGITWSLAGVTGLVLLLTAALVLGLEVFTDSGIGV